MTKKLKMTAQILANFTNVVAGLPDLEEFPEESREKYQQPSKDPWVFFDFSFWKFFIGKT